MLQKLDKQKYVNYTKYRGVILTAKGTALAKALERRHEALRGFLIMIGVNEETADRDACEIEHRIDHETVKRLATFVEYVQSAPQTPPFFKHFKQYCRTGVRPHQCKSKADGETGC
jgi:DtxR family Mn-dependent transcriptional regulator